MVSVQHLVAVTNTLPMKKIVHLLLVVLLTGTIRAQIPNGGMEYWDAQPVLQFWQTNSHPMTLPPWDPYTVRQDTDRYSGNYAANFFANGVFKPMATITYPMLQHPQGLSFYYKYEFAPCVNEPGQPYKDTVAIKVELLQGNTVVDSGLWMLDTSGFTPAYKYGYIPITQNTVLFDSCRITIHGGALVGGCGIVAAATQFKVDHLEFDLPACNHTGVIVQGTNCLLIDTGTGNLLVPCNTSIAMLGLEAGDTIRFSFTANNTCKSICMEGTTIDITCIDTARQQQPCNAAVQLQKQNPTSFIANNGWLKATVSNAALPVNYAWSNSVSGMNADSISNLHEGNYCVTITDINGCTATACDSLAGPHVCIDSALICPPGSLCCDAPLYQPVCGCDSVTYPNACAATFWGGVTWVYPGPCATTGINDIATNSNTLILAPVPAKDVLRITYVFAKAGHVQVRITNALGQTIRTQQAGIQAAGAHTTELALYDVAAGIYFVEARTETERQVKRFVKE